MFIDALKLLVALAFGLTAGLLLNMTPLSDLVVGMLAVVAALAVARVLFGGREQAE